jgi:hypothetical protein
VSLAATYALSGVSDLSGVAFMPSAGGGTNIEVTPSAVNAAVATVAPTISAVRNVESTPAVQAVTAALLAVAVGIGALFGATQVNATMATIAPTVSAVQSTNVAPAVQNSNFALPTSTITAIRTVNVTPSVQNAAFALVAATTQQGLNIAASTQSAAFATQSAAITAVQAINISAGAQNAVFAMDSVVINTGANSAVATENSTFAISEASISVIMTVEVNPSAQNTTLAVVAPTIEITHWLSGYTHRKKITIDQTKVDADLTDFPVRVNLNADGDIGALCRSDGYDIRFTSSDGTTLLKYERENFSVASSQATGDFWVKVPSVFGSTDTVIYIYYGKSDASDGADPENVWDSNFKMVQHLKDNTTSQVLDSTSNNNDGTKKGANEPIQATGKIYKAQDFDGTDDYIDCGTGASLNITGAITLEMWLYPHSLGTWQQILGKGQSGAPAYVNYDFWATTGSRVRFSWGGDGTNGDYLDSGTITANEWVFVAAVIDGSNNVKTYLNGLESATKTTSVSRSAVAGMLEIGGFTDAFFDGLIDEVRISNVARSAAWIKASYHSGNNSLLSLGSEQKLQLNVEVSPIIQNAAFTVLSGATTGGASVAVATQNAAFAIISPDISGAGSINVSPEIVNASFNTITSVITAVRVAEVNPGLQNASFSVLAPAVSEGVNVAVLVQNAVFAVLEVSVGMGADTVAETQNAAFAVQEVEITANWLVTVEPNVLNAEFGVISPTIVGGIEITAQLQNATFDLPAASVLAIQNITIAPEVLAGVLAMPAHSVSAAIGAYVSAGLQNAAFAILGHTVGLGATLCPNTINTVFYLLRVPTIYTDKYSAKGTIYTDKYSAKGTIYTDKYSKI